MEQNNQIQNLLRSKAGICSVVGVAAFCGGAAIGYFAGKKRFAMQLVKTYTNNTVEDSPQEGYVQLSFDELDLGAEWESVEVQEYIKELKAAEAEPEPLPIPVRITPEDLTPEPVNVFFNHDDDWDYDLEMSQRTKTDPYIIHQDEFINDEMGFHQETVTYYQGDDTMTDEHDSPIYNYEDIMGELKFGHGSNDKNVVYIRNESLGMEWEVLLDQGYYSREKIGRAHV